MLVIGSHFHVGQLIAGLVAFMGLALTSSGAVLAEPEHWTLTRKVMSDPIGLKRTKEKEASFLRALDDHQGIIFKICRVYCNHRAEEADLFQEIVYQLWKAYPSFRNKSKVSTWMYSVALKTAMLPYKRGRVKVEFRDVLPDAPGLSEPCRTPGHDEFYKLFHSLNNIDRAIVALMMDGYSRKEIGAIAGMSEEAVTMRVCRLREGVIGKG